MWCYQHLEWITIWQNGEFRHFAFVAVPLTKWRTWRKSACEIDDIDDFLAICAIRPTRSWYGSSSHMINLRIDSQFSFSSLLSNLLIDGSGSSNKSVKSCFPSCKCCNEFNVSRGNLVHQSVISSFSFTQHLELCTQNYIFPPPMLSVKSATAAPIAAANLQQ